MVNPCKRTKDIAKVLSPSNVVIHAVEKQPRLPWSSIWDGVFSKILDNKLKCFQWRLSHGVLNTGERIAKWGIGNGS